MERPVVDVSQAAEGQFHFDTTAIVGKIPNPVIKLLIKQIQKILADTNYVNVTVTIVKAPPLEETVDPQGRVSLRLKNDDPRRRGPEIEIRTLDGLMAGSYTLAMTRTGIAASIPPPRQLLRRVTRGRDKMNGIPPATLGYPAQPAAIGYPVQPAAIEYQREPGAMGYGQAPRGLEEQRQGYGPISRGFGAQARGNGQVPEPSGPLRQGYGQPPRDLGAQQLSRQAPRTFGGQQGQAGRGFGAQRDVRGQDPRGFDAHQPEPGLPRTDSHRFYSSAPVGPQPPRPVPASRIPASSTPRRAPVPPNAFSRPQAGYGQAGGQQQRFDNNTKREKSSGGGCCSGGGDDDEGGQRQGRNGQPQRGYGNGPGRQQGFDKNSKREKSGSGGCCSGGGDDDGGAPARSTYDRLGGPSEDRKKFEKERKKREKKELKRMEAMRKNQKKKVKNAGGYGAPEKSGFWDDKKSDSGCCGMSCC